MIIVTAGMPHWFKQVSVPFLYYFVKALDTGCLTLGAKLPVSLGGEPASWRAFLRGRTSALKSVLAGRTAGPTLSAARESGLEGNKNPQRRNI